MKKIINTDKSPAPIGPYNQAILKDNILFISGQIGLDPISMKLNNDSIEEETNQVMLNLKHILKEANMDFSNVVKTSIFLSDMNLFKKVNKIYESYFKEDKLPARTCIGVTGLAVGASVEIDLVAKV